MRRVTTGLRFIEPQLATSVDQPPEGSHWIHEIKYDGYRCQVLLERGLLKEHSLLKVVRRSVAPAWSRLPITSSLTPKGDLSGRPLEVSYSG
jgi:hypothetical protein